MNNYILDRLKSFDFEKLEKFFFALFLLSIPLQTRLIFITPQTYLNGQFNEYATFFIYLSDIFLVTTFFLYFVNRLTKYNIFSIKSASFSTSPHLIPVFILSIFIAWSFLSAIWSSSSSIAFYQTSKLVELALLAIYLIKRLFWFGLTRIAVIIFISGFFEAIIGISQYLSQKSLGLKILGESILTPNLDNVAKIVVDGERIIRTYGTFPHPNVFGAFLILSVFCGIYLLLTVAIQKQIVPRLPAVANGILNFLALLKGKKAIVSRETIYNEAKVGETIWVNALIVGVILQLTVLILTFSRIAWIVAALLILIWGFWLLRILYLRQKENYGFHPPTFLLKLFHVKQSVDFGLNKEENLESEEISAGRRETILIFISLLLIITALWPQINSRTIDIGNKYQQSIDYRVLYSSIAAKMINAHLLTGIGNGNFTLKMKDYSPIPLEWWQYQPAHNIYLLITSELGVIGLILFLIFIFSVLKVAYLKQNSQIVSRETIWLRYLILSIFIGFLFMGLFDHYFWTLQQGRLTFWFVIGILSALSSQN